MKLGLGLGFSSGGGVSANTMKSAAGSIMVSASGSRMESAT